MKDCQAGCKYFSGGEVKHHKDCVHYPESFSKMYDDIYQQNKEKDAEIQRLTKEVEEYKVVVKNYDKIGSEKTETITSLRELLSRVQEEVRSPYMTDPERKNVLIDIDNALNPVYSPPYIEGKTDLQNEG